MKKLPRALALLCFILVVLISFRANGHQGCSRLGADFGERSILSTGKSGTGANIDVLYHRFDWSLNPDAGRTINGSATTYFKTIVSNVQSISFDLHSNLTVTAVRFRGANLASTRITRSGHVLNINLGTNLAVNFIDSVTITYGGTPPAQSGGAEGFKLSGAGSDKYIWTLSESYEDRDWWPCKADMQDKIDSVDFVITVPSAYWVAANGKLVDSTIIGANRRFIFKHRYPIASYLIAIAVAKYNRYYRGAVTIGGKQVPIIYYIRSSHGNVNNALTAMDKVKEELQQFSLKFGDYPFKNEHYGMYEFGFSGGMEHQGFSGMSFNAMSSWSTIAHEVAHQWFGNKVTFATWNHLWIAEGFAKYLEVLAAELVPTLLQNPRSHLSSIRSSARTHAATSAYIPDASAGTANGIWSSAYATSVYMRGAMVVSMLRTLLGDDKFFLACRNFLNDPQLAYKSATTAQLKNHFSAVAGIDLTAFFEDYVYNGGYPSYQVNYGRNNNRLTIQLTQTGRTSTSRSFMHTPVVLRVSNAAGNRDTTIVIYHQNGAVSKAGNGISSPVAGNILYYNLSFAPASVSFDPDFKTMSTGSASFLASLPIEIESFSAKSLVSANHLRLTLRETYQHDDIILQRSWDGFAFSDLGKMQRSSTALESIEYFYLDESRAQGVSNYYRARITDIDGSVAFTSIQKLEPGESTSGFRLHPTITKDKIQVIFPTNWKDRKVRLILYDNTGRLLRRYSRENSDGFDIAVGDLPPGQYFLSAVDDSHQKITRPFTIQY